MKPAERLVALERERPEWAAWLAVIGVVTHHLHDKAWEKSVPVDLRPLGPGTPLLAGATLQPDRPALASLFRELTDTAISRGVLSLGRQRMALTVEQVLGSFIAVVNCENEKIGAIAREAEVTVESLRPVVELLVLPCLYAIERCCRGSIRRGWSHGYCPICGSWPACVEICGIERRRYLRCARCGAGWEALALSCAYCGTIDHEELGSLVLESARASYTVEVCNRCAGYTKAFTLLAPSDAAELMVADLATAELDIAAAMRGYRRPQTAGCALGAKLASRDARRYDQA
jgi:hypothetical protein